MKFFVLFAITILYVAELKCEVPPIFTKGRCCPKRELPDGCCGCQGTVCPDNEVCKLKDVICIRAPCCPVPECVPRKKKCAPRDNPPVPKGCRGCRGHVCYGQDVCILEEVICKRAPCCPVPRCIDRARLQWPKGCCGHQCPDKHFCKMQEVRCKGSICPAVPQCIPREECVSRKNPPIPKGCKNGCKNHQCLNSEFCKLREVICIRAPCCPVPECISRKRLPCPEGCCGIKCPCGKVCELEKPPCSKLPCPSPKPRCITPEIPCVPRTGPPLPEGCTTCFGIACPVGQFCWQQPTLECNDPPCCPNPKCISRDRLSFPKGCCNVICGPGQVCKVIDEGAQCVPKCSSEKC